MNLSASQTENVFPHPAHPHANAHGHAPWGQSEGVGAWSSSETGEGRVGDRTRVVVIGGGLSGLTAAYRIWKQGDAPNSRPLELMVLEAKDRIGGAIWTEKRDGFLLEGGADSFVTNKPWGLDLCRELGLADRLESTSDKNRRSFVVHRGKLVAIPDGFVLMGPARLWPTLTTPILSARGKFRLLWDLFLPRKDDDQDESLASFVKRRLGREALERLVQPLVGGIYTADPAELSMKSTMPQYLEMERTHGSLIRAARRQSQKGQSVEANSSGARYGLFVTPADGMSSLPQALADALPRGTVRLNAPVRRLLKTEGDPRPWRIEMLDGPPIDADAVVLSVESHAAARLADGFDPLLAQHLRAIPYASSAIQILAYRRDQIAHPLNGFGVVVPAVEQRSILAISFTSVKFPSRAPEGTVLLRVFVGGAMQPDLFDLDDDAIGQIARQEAAELLGIQGEPMFSRLSRHARAMPQYVLGHAQRVEAIRDQARTHERLALAGNAYEGVGVPDCIRSGQEAASAILASLQAGLESAP